MCSHTSSARVWCLYNEDAPVWCNALCCVCHVCFCLYLTLPRARVSSGSLAVAHETICVVACVLRTRPVWVGSNGCCPSDAHQHVCVCVCRTRTLLFCCVVEGLRQAQLHAWFSSAGQDLCARGCCVRTHPHTHTSGLRGLPCPGYVFCRLSCCSCWRRARACYGGALHACAHRGPRGERRTQQGTQMRPCLPAALSTLRPSCARHHDGCVASLSLLLPASAVSGCVCMYMCGPCAWMCARATAPSSSNLQCMTACCCLPACPVCLFCLRHPGAAESAS